MSYYLSEVYSDIYNPRKTEELFDNLRFIDYMQDSDIQEVVEELVWEFRDYGNTLEESFEMISFATIDEVICESYDDLFEDILYEATVTRSNRGPITSSIGRPSIPSGGSFKITLGRGDKPTSSGSTKVTSSNRFDQNVVNRRATRIARIRSARNSVKSRLDQPIKAVKQAISGSYGGIKGAAKELGSKAKETGKAMLKGLLRRGASAMRFVGKKAGQAAYGAGRAIEASGRQAASAPATTRTARVGGRQVTVTTEPTPEVGRKRKALGRVIRKIGSGLQKISRPEKTPITSKPQPTTPTPELGFKKLGKGEDSKWTPSAANRSARRRMGMARPEKPTGKFGQNLRGSALSLRGRALGKSTREARSQLEEILQQLSFDMIKEGYVDNVDSAYTVINNLNDVDFWELVNEYIE